LKYYQEKLSKGMRNSSHKKEKDLNVMDWQVNGAFKRGKKGQFKKEKGKKL
jgi:hypothetical protein